MVILRSIYAVGEKIDLSDDEKDLRLKVHAKIQSLYASGRPLFTREAIQDLAEQLRSLNGGSGKVFVTGLDGAVVDFNVEPGRVIFPFRTDMERILEEPLIAYSSIESLTSMHTSYSASAAYCSLRVQHYTAIRHTATQEIIPDDFDGPLVTSPPIHDITRTLMSTREEWKDGQQYAALIEILQSISISTNLRKIVAFACGNLHGDSYSTRSLFQHALVLSLHQWINETKDAQDLDVRCCFQDPAYTENEKRVIRESNASILDDPEGFLEVDESTVVLSFAPQVPVKQIITELALPALIIWDRDQPSPFVPHHIPMADPNSSRVRDTLRNFYDKIELPLDYHKFGDLDMFIRRTINLP